MHIWTFLSVFLHKTVYICELCVSHFWLVSLVQGIIEGGGCLSTSLVAAGTHTYVQV